MELAVDTNLVDPDLLVRGDGPPHGLFKAWRESDPVHWNPPPAEYQPGVPGFSMDRGFWVLTKYADVFEVSRDWKRFSCREEAVVIWDLEPETLEGQRAGIMSMDPPQHAELKRLVMPPFAPAALKAFEPEIDRVADEIIDEVAGRGGCEFVFDVAAKLPVYTFCRLMGIPDADREKIATLGNKLVDLETPDAGQLEAQMELFVYSQQLAEAKRTTPDASMMSLLATGEVDGDRLSDEQINAFFVTMAIAGHETTRSTASHLMRALSAYSDQRALLMEDLDARLPRAIEEALRLWPPVIQFKRIAMQDAVLSGRSIKKGEKLYLSYPAANRDPEMFDAPDRFDILRENADKHLSFGTGPHVCIAARLARRQLFALFRSLLTRLPDVQVIGDPKRLRSIWHDAILSLPVRYAPEQ